ncbi:cyclic pyranopterin monophosphate synthase MoaC [Serpentinicella alkaliphila]|uniref:Cyclic pyranopterin monophosphate synthase n=1 Tax=Serpentinicella alkaliphila TaxID=1734049 RepID=A0A4R2UJT6_9FIRM|nr:cyclic pyranopterin monophosphate synthase MoaC [Serpentinicella alkaliphila]QUH26845.1 cyclic pyranopterin monophosphate synthase MoaC [Serpentinicella alkaliphila]TCQ08073.1 cyclic pyranopterin monophosphate synthase subunit MoaC [Serpentinicella alkaliphila]
MEFTHFNESGKAKMVSVDDKADTKRVAVAKGTINVSEDTFNMVVNGTHKKGDVISVAQIAGIMGAKKTSDLIPMCHNIFISGADLKFELDSKNSAVNITATVSTVGKTGVEMEALTAVTTAALTIYDMCKAVDKNMVIENIRLIEKLGGKSGHYLRGEE